MTPAVEPLVERVAAAYEQLRPDSVEALVALYADDAWFRDPFNDVRGRPAIARIFHHMFQTVEAPRFVVTGRFVKGDAAMLTWTFHLRFRGERRERVIPGASHLRFDDAGRITAHRDYWDAAEELYAHLPVIGALVRWLQRRLRTPQP